MTLTPRRVYVRITRVCNARCDYCPSWQMAKEFPSLDRLSTILDGLAAARTAEVRFTGGEPVLHRDFFALVRRSRELGMMASVITNGTLFHPRYAAAAAEAGLASVLISLDAPDAEIHDRIRLVPSLYRTATTGAARFKVASPATRLEVNMVVSADTVDRIADAVTAYAELGIGALNLIPIKDAPSRAISVAQMRRHNAEAEALSRLAARLGITVNPPDFDLFGRDDAQLADSAAGLYPARNRCYVPFAEAFVDAITGLVWPCDSTPYAERNCHTVGDLAEASFDQIWASRRFHALRMAFRNANPVPCSRKCDPSNAVHSERYGSEVETQLACHSAGPSARLAR